MKINIINYETGYGENWIFTALANKINRGFLDLGHQSIISTLPEPEYDLYFHISYGQAQIFNSSAKHVVYITHIDELEKLERVVRLSLQGGFFLCMSNDTAWRLNRFTRSKKFHGILSPSLEVNEDYDYDLKLFFSYRIYPDGRKNIDDVFQIINTLSQKVKLKINIMGAGWENILQYNFGPDVYINYHEIFDKKIYHNILKNTDYLCNTGLDEGAISVLDALVHKRGVITTAQGYHLDFSSSCNYHLYASNAQLETILHSIANQKIEENSIYHRLTSWEIYCHEILSRLSNSSS